MDVDKQALLTEIDRIKSLPTPARWRAAHDFARKVNPTVKQEQDIHAKEMTRLRQEQKNKFASSKEGMRLGISIPATTVAAIRAFDPGFLMDTKDRNERTDDTNKVVRTLMKLFPEYRVPKEI